MFSFEYIVIYLISVQTVITSFLNDYHIQRERLIEDELSLQLGGKLQLTEEEIVANKILMRWKLMEINDSYSQGYFNLSKHYFTYKNRIPESKVYQIIRRMPKGAALHLHSTLMLSADRLMELTYEDHLYACLTSDDIILRFSSTTPVRPCPVKWTLLSELRNDAENATIFDMKLKKHFTLYTEDENDLNADINTVWNRFNKVCDAIKSLISYRPMREKFFYKALKEFYDDNIMYIEIRSGLNLLYELDGSVHDVMYLPKLYEQVARRFKDDHPDFIGIKFIVTKFRRTSFDQMREDLATTLRLKNDMPDTIAGFDLVGQEDLGNPLLYYLPAFDEARNDINFYFHGGETNRYGSQTDENLVDAVLIGTKRIGHGYALLKHPAVLATIKKRDIAIEVNVISNVVLALVRDVRNHPLAVYLALGLPVVLSSDDPGAWGADPLSHDFYVAFVGVASSRADIRLLKQLAINSIRYSALDDRGKAMLFRGFNRKWNLFIKDVIAENK